MSSKEDKNKKKVKELVKELKKLFPKPKMALNYSTNWELLVSVILSAQCTDKKVNEVTKKLFRKYKKLDDYINVGVLQFEKDIKQIGLYKSKTKNILESAKIIKDKHGGRVPKTMDEILELKGVGRKTANVVLGNAYGVISGIAVDTHVMRLSKRFGLTKGNNPVRVEKDLMMILPKDEWLNFTHLMINYGREYCSARTCKEDHILARFDS